MSHWPLERTRKGSGQVAREWYDDDCDPLGEGRYLNNARRSLRGRKGQAVLREVRAALLAMPEKRLIAGDLLKDGEVCAIGAWARFRLAHGPIKGVVNSARTVWHSWDEVVDLCAPRYDEGGGTASDSRYLAQAMGANWYVASEIGATNDALRYETDERGVLLREDCEAGASDARPNYDGPRDADWRPTTYYRHVPLTPERRWQKMLAWLESQMLPAGVGNHIDG
jgi:hypothetical protein